MRSNGPEQRPLSKIFGRFHCQEALESVPPFLTYRARTQGLAGFERVFAVKTLPADAQPSRADGPQRLLAVASGATRVRDARIGQVVDSGTSADGTTYVATEFLFGSHLAGISGSLGASGASGSGSTLGPDPLPSTLAVQLLSHIGAEVAAALAAAHETKPALVHAGLSPSNVFVTLRGAVKTIDFGQRAAVLPGLEGGGKRLLNLYAAPELLLAGEGSPQADVFALGSILFEVATGKTPPSARNPRSPSDLSRAMKELPNHLREAILALLRADPTRRPHARQAEALLREAAADGSETEIRGHLAALARRRSGTATPSPSESAMLPSDGATGSAASVPAASLHEATTRPAATKRPRTPQHTIPFFALINEGEGKGKGEGEGQKGAVPEAHHHASETAEVPPSRLDIALAAGQPLSSARSGPAHEAFAPLELTAEDLEVVLPGRKAGPAGAGADEVVMHNGRPPLPMHKAPPMPRAGKQPARQAPNMENLTTGEMEAMFSHGFGDVERPPAPLPDSAQAAFASTQVPADDDFLDDAETNAFSRRRFPNLLSDIRSGASGSPQEQGKAAAEPALPLWQAEDAAPRADGVAPEATVQVEDAQLLSDSTSRAVGLDTPSEQAQRAHSSHDNELDDDDIVPARAPRGRLWVMLGTASIVAAVAGVVGGHLLPIEATAAKKPDQALETAPLAAPAPAAPSPVEPVVATAEPATDEMARVPQDMVVGAPLVNHEPANAASPAPRDKQGRLLVTLESVPPGAAIWINGGHRGITPATVELKARHRSLVLIKAGHERLDEELDHAQLGALHALTLRPLQGPPASSGAEVEVECQKPGLYPIAIDGKQTGLLCPAVVPVSPGTHDVSVYVPWRFKSYEARVTLAVRQTKLVKFTK